MQKPNLSSFLGDYNRMLFDSVGRHYRDNFDTRRFGPEPPDGPRSIRTRASMALSRLLAGVGLARTRAVLPLIKGGLHFVQPHLAELEWLYAHLADQESRDLLVSLIAYRALGYRRVKLACNKPSYWANIRRMEECARNTESVDASFFGWQLHKLDLRPLGFPFALFTTPTAASVDFIEEQYRCVMADRSIQACYGEAVIDAGGCWGDTALYFANKVGPAGRVFSFEFLPANLEILLRNLDLNPDLRDRVALVERPLWSVSDQTLFINGNGPATRVETKPSVPDAPTIKTLSIDDLVTRRGLDRLDFIKMDIEGAEVSALRGAEGALRRFRPKLAIAVYHSLSDFWSVPQFLDTLGVGYRFFLRHFTIHAEETVLFAEPVGSGDVPRSRPHECHLPSLA
jgi:FkbM family methyltransferase